MNNQSKTFSGNSSDYLWKTACLRCETLNLMMNKKSRSEKLLGEGVIMVSGNQGNVLFLFPFQATKASFSLGDGSEMFLMKSAIPVICVCA